ncbi:hypothetical protein RFI_00034 [Reticulomyxa filosa]|uniref:Uncharacterized protein n=1 Tax=Reticulomyxa filosa TaxID=46433 RepID=X6PFZ5_RETFI|nr:hypothetical protein RFI_00034 [Reticulomyxa filosa]|eukprot:ETO37028.1 hypothetical protein RFI_00034 [Reticulomyxa filosa]
MQSSKKQKTKILQRGLMIVPNLSENKEEEELNDENIWKESKKTRKDYFCKISPTLVFTNVNGKELVSQTPILKFIGHFQVKIDELQSIAEQFNSRQQSKSQELDNDEKQEPKNKKQSIPFCLIFRKDYQL